MYKLTRFVAAGAMVGVFLLTGCAGEAPLLTKPWNGLRPTAKASKPAKTAGRSSGPKTGPSDDIPTAASVGLSAKP